MAQNFKNLLVYQEAYASSKDIYKITERIEGNFRLKEQLFGSATATPANLAEMSSMENKNQQANKIRVCIGECNETEFWLTFCRDVGLVTEQECKEHVNRNSKIRMMLFALLKSMAGGKATV